MPTLDEMFGKPKEQALDAPVDILPDETATRTGGSFDTGAGRDVMLVASPFTPEAHEFFNKDNEERTLEAQRPTGPFPQLTGDINQPAIYQGDPAQPVEDQQLQRGVDALTDALGPSIENVSRFGEFGGGVGPSSELSLTQLREAVRSILKRL